MRPSDFNEINRVYSAIHQTLEFPLGPHWSAQELSAELETGGGWVAVDEPFGPPDVRPDARPDVRPDGETTLPGSLLGFILFRDQLAALEITFLGMAPAARKRGVMRRLIGEMTQHSQPIWLEVHESNLAARRLYESAGFREVGKRPRYYPDGGAAVLYNYG